VDGGAEEALGEALGTEEDPMAMVTDPVCGMRIDTEDAAAHEEHGGTTYYFCSETCHEAFVADPGSYVK
jgi:Cu+-exporting ATPase